MRPATAPDATRSLGIAIGHPEPATLAALAVIRGPVHPCSPVLAVRRALQASFRTTGLRCDCSLRGPVSLRQPPTRAGLAREGFLGTRAPCCDPASRCRSGLARLPAHNRVSARPQSGFADTSEKAGGRRSRGICNHRHRPGRRDIHPVGWSSARCCSQSFSTASQIAFISALS